MPNTGRITICPFFKSEKGKSISCEDAVRRFRYGKNKEDWMNRYCDTYSWEQCPHAIELVKGEDGDMNQVKTEALQKEVKKLSSMLTKCEKRADAKDATIKELRRKNRALEHMVLSLKQQIEKIQIDNEKFDKQLAGVVDIYEARICYLMDTFSGRKLIEEDVRKWSEGKQFAIVAERDKKGNFTHWNALIQEDKDDGNKKNNASKD